MFGRSSANTPVTNYKVEDVYQELSEELQIPIIYDIDCGHVPPQITFINGAYAKVDVDNGKGNVFQTFIWNGNSISILRQGLTAVPVFIRVHRENMKKEHGGRELSTIKAMNCIHNLRLMA